MVKVTLDDLEYESDDFTDLQKNILSEINYNGNVQTQLRYQLQSIKTTGDMLIGKLKEDLTTKTESE
jgi:hypothetical protein|tara:strand:+ start:2354 stop:2554 length:201 start_codon:yes stop_codon:yes gene_type:complete